PPAVLYTLSLHDALPILARCGAHAGGAAAGITVLSTLALMHWKWLVPAAALVAAAFSFSALLGDSPSADVAGTPPPGATLVAREDRKSTRLNSSHVKISY